MTGDPGPHVDRPVADAPRHAADHRLRDVGLRATRPRVTVLDWLDANPGHHPAETLVDRTGLSKATVYHVLGQLCDAGLVLPAESGAGRMRYETGSDPHHHFVCRSCGRIIDVPCVVGERPCLTADVPGAHVDAADVILKGLCADCA